METDNLTKFKVTHSPISSIDSIPSSPDRARTTFFLHATNRYGVWGTGIARALKKRFPEAPDLDKLRCRQDVPRGVLPDGDELDSLVGKCHIISSTVLSSRAPSPFFIVCLRTSRGYGRKYKGRAGLDPKDLVLEQTRSALQDFRAQLEQSGKERQREIVVWSPQINSGGFMVPWERTEEVIEEVFDGWEGQWFVMTPP